MTQRVIRDLFRELVDELRALRARPDEAHVPAQHVENLRQLVDAQLSDHRADACDAWIRLLRPLGLAVALRVRAHAAEFENLEVVASETNTLLAIDYWRAPAVLELDCERRQHQDRQRHQDRQQARQQIEEPRGKQPQWVAAEPLTEDHPARIQHFDAHSSRLAFEKSE